MNSNTDITQPKVIDEKIAINQSTTSSQKYIVYENRRITVLNGQPYYESSGLNSGCKDIWLPFILIKGNKKPNFNALPQLLDKEACRKHWDLYSVGDFVKLTYRSIRGGEFHYFYRDATGIFLDSNLLKLKMSGQQNRMPLKVNLVDSSRLGGGKQFTNYLNRASLSPSQLQDAQQPIIFTNKPDFKISENDPDKVNDWLISQGGLKLQLEKLTDSLDKTIRKTNENLALFIRQLKHKPSSLELTFSQLIFWKKPNDFKTTIDNIKSHIQDIDNLLNRSNKSASIVKPLIDISSNEEKLEALRKVMELYFQ